MQDLEKQLAHARQQLSHFRSTSTDGVFSEDPPYHLSMPTSKPDSHRSKRQKSTVMPGFSRTRQNLKIYGHGIFKVPGSSSPIAPVVQSSTSSPELPPKKVGDELLDYYRDSIQLMLPIIDWPSLIQTYELAYKENSTQHIPRVRVALLFVVFAFGSLRHSLAVGWTYLEASKCLIDLWTEDFDLDYVRYAIFSSIFLVEMNLKSAGLAWLGFAGRIAQDIGLHSDFGNWTIEEQEMRRRVWWCIYAYDRCVKAEDEGETLSADISQAFLLRTWKTRHDQRGRL